jgi:1,4-alpha-glucan branching enzyme
MAPSRGYFLLILHAHLPLVLAHGRWPHGSEWLAEVVVGSYLRLLEQLDALVARGRTAPVTVSCSPVLCEQLAHPRCAAEVEAYLAQRLEAVADDRARFERAGEGALVDLTYFWDDVYRRALAHLRRLDGDLLGALKQLAAAGAVELITSAATHGYLPLLGRDESIDLQLRVGCAAHARHFGQPARGVWLPECAYRPRYTWTPPAGPLRGRVRRHRRGLEEFLAAHGLEYFVADAHLLQGGEARTAYRDYYPALRALGEEPSAPAFRRDLTPYRPYLVTSRDGSGGAAVLLRDPRTTMQVWSRDQGYPGDGAYLEFHKRHAPGGLRYWRVTDPRSALDAKERYDPAAAFDRTRVHAAHFAALVHDVLAAGAAQTPQGAVAVNPYDAELFGHWWFEGPQFVGAVLERLPAAGVTVTTPAAVLARHPPTDTVSLLEGSWGDGGDHRMWLNPRTAWTWDMLYAVEEDFWTLAGGVAWEGHPLLSRLLAQLARELLLLQASDWQFLITTGSARDYAESRFAEHYAHCVRLSQLLRRAAEGQPLGGDDETFLAAREAQDFPFPDIAEHVRAAAGVRAA